MVYPLRVVTYNVWHGLDGRGVARFGNLEPEGRRHTRLLEQVEGLRRAAADFIFLQEVNPVDQLGAYYAERLGMEEASLADNTGIKIFGLGIPANLYSGLLLLYKKPWTVRWVKKLQLSGDVWSFSSRLLSLQLRESRYALLAELEHPVLGRALVANVHLHHGVGVRPETVKVTEQLVEQQKLALEDKNLLIQRLAQADDRRLHETNILVRRFEAESSKKQVIKIMAGDFNSRPEFSNIKHLLKRHFSDAWTKARPGDPGFSWDPQVNQLNIKYFENFLVGADISDLSLSGEARLAIRESFYQSELQQRRIDYIFYREEQHLELANVTFLGLESEPRRLLKSSDHLGLVADFRINPEAKVQPKRRKAHEQRTAD